MTGEMTAGRRFKAIFAGSIGNLVQWYDWYIYSSAALYFAPVFFPKGNQTAQLLQAAVVFFVGFLARPIGAWAMGHYGDRVGRKAALKLAVAMMATGSLAIALCPGASSIGVWASVVLVLARIFQGLSLGGEYGASATYISEMAGKKHRGFWSSFNYVTLLGGNLIALSVLIILQTVLTADEMREYGWRIPFAVGALLSVFAYWLRERMEESQSFAVEAARGQERQRPDPAPETSARDAHHHRDDGGRHPDLLCLHRLYAEIPRQHRRLLAAPRDPDERAGAVPVHVLPAGGGFISDKLGRKQVLAVSYAASMLATYPILSAIAGKPSMAVAFGLVFLGMVLQSGYTATGSVVKAELFPTSVRTLGVGLPYAIANTLFGGSAESLALWFKSIGHETAFYIYTSVVLVFSFLVALMLPDSRLSSKILED